MWRHPRSIPNVDGYELKLKLVTGEVVEDKIVKSPTTGIYGLEKTVLFSSVIGWIPKNRVLTIGCQKIGPS